MPKQFIEDEIKKKLTPEQYHVLREKGTEAPFTGKYLNHGENGMYTCAVCGAEIFSSDTKFNSGTGWPSFNNPANTKAIKLTEDRSQSMRRVEVSCANCGSHLGHVFNDAPNQPTGMRFCINSACLGFKPKGAKAKK
ncbi:peptide-methionine (R)-S-oxide reductase MsrB [Candidatus Saccharibacteria bacterium]|nr:peptide-methionine (R)-S-oxide reductase MsrB [Candidatus Saccharibacteria bacterium]